LITRREQFHDLRIGELVTVYSPATQARLAAVQENFVNKGFDAPTALKQSYAVIKSLVTREAFVMAFNDAFLVISVTLLVCAAAIWFCKPSRAEEAHSSAG
jgi:DHA2 family multidrug resistance protein